MPGQIHPDGRMPAPERNERRESSCRPSASSELDGGFPVFTFGAISLSTLQIFLLPHIWIAVTPRQKSEPNKQRDYPEDMLADSLVSTCHRNSVELL